MMYQFIILMILGIIIILSFGVIYTEIVRQQAKIDAMERYIKQLEEKEGKRC